MRAILVFFLPEKFLPERFLPERPAFGDEKDPRSAMEDVEVS
ncbi:hypothetical protein [Streptomyces sp. NPDC088400]